MNKDSGIFTAHSENRLLLFIFLFECDVALRAIMEF